MKILAVLFVLATSVCQAQSQLARYCERTGGQVIDQWICPNSKVQRTGEYCLQQSVEGEPLVFNGCSAPANKYNERFFRACIIHDLCYHHEPLSNGKSKTQCDNDFYNNMIQLCNSLDQAQEASACEIAAKTYYKAVVVGGGFMAWECSKIAATYPDDMGKLPKPSTTP